MKHFIKPAILALGATLILAGCSQNQTDTATPTPTPAPTDPSPTPAPQITVASISGTLTIEGAVVQNTTALMLQRKVGEVEYKEFDRAPAADGLVWSFNQGIAGQVYEITSALQVNQENAATSNVVTTTAPAASQKLFVKTDLNIPAPSSAPNVTCGEPDNTGGYNATIYYPRTEKAAGYYYQVGSEPGTDDVDKGYTKAPVDPQQDPTNKVYVKQNTEYFTRYAWTACVDCNVYDLQNWSPWSPTTGFQCPSQ